MIEFTKENGLILQIIEFESPDEDATYLRYHVDLKRIEQLFGVLAKKISFRDMQHRKKYHLKNGGEVEIVRPMHNTEFCRYCNRIRVTSDGKLKPCLFRNDHLVDLLGPIRNEVSNASLKELFLEAMKVRKPYFT